LLIIKQTRNLSDESVAERWYENPDHQDFCGETFFQWEFPCHPAGLVYFSRRIGEKGVEKILQISIDLHRAKAKEREILVDTMVQEKNITFPTDTKLYKQIVDRCVAIAHKEGEMLRQSCRRTAEALVLAQRFRNLPKNYRKARRAARKLKTIAGRLRWDVTRKLPSARFSTFFAEFAIFDQLLSQQRKSSNKVYSLHEPPVYCVGKGKKHKRYEFGAKASVAVRKDGNIIVGAVSHPKNEHDCKTVTSVIEQVTVLRNLCPYVTICDRGYRAKSRAPVIQESLFQNRQVRKLPPINGRR